MTDRPLTFILFLSFVTLFSILFWWHVKKILSQKFLNWIVGFIFCHAHNRQTRRWLASWKTNNKLPIGWWRHHYIAKTLHQIQTVWTFYRNGTGTNYRRVIFFIGKKTIKVSSNRILYTVWWRNFENTIFEWSVMVLRLFKS